MTQVYEVAIIGAGAVCSAIARELARYDLSVGLRIRSHAFRDHALLTVTQGQRVLFRQKFRRLLVNTSIDLSGGPLKIKDVDQ